MHKQMHSFLINILPILLLAASFCGNTSATDYHPPAPPGQAAPATESASASTPPPATEPVPATEPTPAPATSSEEITTEMAYKAAVLLERNPNHEHSASFAQIAFAYAEKSDRVLVEIRGDYFPWMVEGAPDYQQIPSETNTLLMGAFIAGNIKKQLEIGIKENLPLQGFTSMLHVYKARRMTHNIELIEAIEKWLEMSEDELYAFIEEIEGINYKKAVQNSTQNITTTTENFGYLPAVNNFIYESTSIYDTIDLGKSVRYRDKTDSSKHIDLYIYPVAPYYSEYKPQDIMNLEYRKIKSDIAFAQDSGAYDEVKTLREGTLPLAEDSTTPVFHGVLSLKQNHKVLYSAIYLAMIDGRFVKIRATYPANENTAAKEYLNEEALTLIRETNVKL